MAVGVELFFPDATVDQYDHVIRLMGFDPGGPGAPDSLFHWVRQDGDGIRVVDVWRNKESFEAFAAKEIGPRTQEVGIQSPPQVTFFQVHNYLTAG